MEYVFRGQPQAIDSAELRLLLHEVIGGPGQYDGLNRNLLHIPLGGDLCQVVLEFKGGRIVSIKRGPSFNAAEWERFGAEVGIALLVDHRQVGREISFSSFPVTGSWRGTRSGVQILPPPDQAPLAPMEMAEHPFLLEFSLLTSTNSNITNHRRLREHRRFTLLLNVLLAGRTSVQQRRPDNFWASIQQAGEPLNIQWVRQFYFTHFGEVVVGQLTPESLARLTVNEKSQYYNSRRGIDGLGLSVPDDLDQSIVQYQQLSASCREKFDRAIYWMDMASRQWNISMSLSFAALVSAVEALTERGITHNHHCPECNKTIPHDSPGATERFRTFFENHAPDASDRSRRNEMYALRSGILHGSDLMKLDHDLAFGWDPPWRNEWELHEELWGLTRTAIRHWLQAAS
jgi:hypothetical protein